MINTAACDNNLHSSSKSGKFSWKKLGACFSIALIATLLQGCRGGTIRGITGQMPNPGTGGPFHFELAGDGVCGKVSFDFGDGTPPIVVPNYDFLNNPVVDHLYTGWGGKKTVKAGSVEKCVGSAQETIEVAPVVFKLGYAQPRPSACDFIPGKPPLRTGTKVHITTNPDPNVKINFGCLLNNCVYDANGINSMATSGYPFPGLRPLSLVLRVGTESFQGGTDVTFTTHQTGPLEVCVNDDNLSDNTGAWGIFIEVDESAVP